MLLNFTLGGEKNLPSVFLLSDCVVLIINHSSFKRVVRKVAARCRGKRARQ